MAFGHMISFPSLRASDENKTTVLALHTYPMHANAPHYFNSTFPENPSLGTNK